MKKMKEREIWLICKHCDYMFLLKESEVKGALKYGICPCCKTLPRNGCFQIITKEMCKELKAKYDKRFKELPAKFVSQIIEKMNPSPVETI